MGSETQNAPEAHVAVDEIPLAQPFSILITVCDNTDVGEMRVDALMPAHQHDLNYTPKVTALGDGLFRVDNMLFHMPGLWELQVDVGFGDRSVSYTSNVMLK
ncbi:hypothetical protein [uncultured Ruegeria sp.]|uniref:FixH family protein n=1 Tax=uncultured Ruegeria sp. TaxID=259304 RepID=UPI0026075758|nr:hypothetical protein [uncultured Ruegeria sp.]